MIDYLESLLDKKTKESQSEILYAQWNYDKKLIPVALNAISNLFPHFSLHDESHSVSIINNIIRVLGKENVEKLSAIDIWMILEASYSHDIGMVVTSDELVKSFTEPEFIAFFKEIQADDKNSLHEFASQFDIKENKICYKNDLVSIQYHDGIKFILADYFRKKHADRSKEIINNPKERLSLLSPRGVIPQRIFKILGEICACHTKEFTDVMKLPFCEVGIDVEDAHPRFISCLLRIGDLLDLDNNRFSEVMLRTLSKIPLDTFEHRAHHLSIEKLRIDRETIEITAKSDDYNIANITQHWFNYLNEEVKNQMVNWNNIVPSKEFGYLPTVGDLTVELIGYEFIDGKNKPRFTVDTDKALTLLQGAGLYEGAYQCIREILQNAVDATLIRIWMEHQYDKTFDVPNCADFKEVVKNYPITISIKDMGVEGEWKNWLIEIEDKGTGISSNDLKYLMNTGSSSKNRERSTIIDSMKVWMRPSGIFGIGFQSIFMLTDKVTIETKSFTDEQFQIIELYSPNSPRNGDILIQKKKTSHDKKPGTKLIITYKAPVVPESWSINEKQGNAQRKRTNYDPFTCDSLDIDVWNIIDEVLEFAEKNYFRINLKLNEKIFSTSQSGDDPFVFFDPDNFLEIRVSTKSSRRGAGITTFYKNQEVKNKFHIEFLNIEVNIHGDKATEVLTLNRNEINSNYQYDLLEKIFSSVFKFITTNFHFVFEQLEDKVLASMFLHYYHGNYESLIKYDIKQFDYWEACSIKIGDEHHEMKKLLEDINTLHLIYDNRFRSEYSEKIELDGEVLKMRILAVYPYDSKWKFLLYKAKDFFTTIHKSKDGDGFSNVLFGKQKGESPIDMEYLKEIIGNFGNYAHYSRGIIPCIEGYFDLRIKDDAYEYFLSVYKLDSNVFLYYPRMLSPFIVEEVDSFKRYCKSAVNDKLFNWVFENRYDQQTTLEQIKGAYKRFIEEFEPLLPKKLDDSF